MRRGEEPQDGAGRMQRGGGGGTKTLIKPRREKRRINNLQKKKCIRVFYFIFGGNAVFRLFSKNIVRPRVVLAGRDTRVGGDEIGCRTPYVINVGRGDGIGNATLATPLLLHLPKTPFGSPRIAAGKKQQHGGAGVGVGSREKGEGRNKKTKKRRWLCVLSRVLSFPRRERRVGWCDSPRMAAEYTAAVAPTRPPEAARF